MVNYIFGFFLIVGIIYSFLTGNTEAVNQSIILSGTKSMDMILKMIPLLCLWLGIMKIASVSGLLEKIAGYASIIIKPIFPELKKDGESISYITSNIVMNMMGLGNAATPFGLKAMKSMQEENSKKEVASRSMITFLIINTASVTIIPTTVISFRLMHQSSNPTDIVGACIITTVLSLLIGLILDRIFYSIWRNFG